jgi:pyruvate dehydrogenase E2 component (dihydrolipoamide acetyltransferase)
MPSEIVMPRLGWNMETGSLGEWLKQPGERVEAGDLLFTVEGDKATQEVEALDGGTLYIPPGAPGPGIEVPVGTLLGYLLLEGEAPPASAQPGYGPPAGAQPIAAQPGAGPPTAAPLPAGSETPALAPQPVATAAGRASTAAVPAISPRARRVARELGVNWVGLAGSGRTGRIRERDVRAAAARAARTSPVSQPAVERISPLARRLAAELGVDVDALAARLPGKRIERADVEAAAIQARKPVSEPAAPAAPAGLPGGTLTPVSAVRRLIAARMAGSAQSAAAVTLTTEADATELVRLRRELNEADKRPVPSYNDLFARLIAEALLEHPGVNARFEGDAILQPDTVNIGLAVDTDRGLLVPVLRDVQGKSLRQIAAESAALVERARTGQIGPDELRGGTFTITNLGMYDIDAFTPIINLPECAILGVGRIVPKQVVVDADAGRVAIRHMVFLSLTFDHRLVDGAPAARFLQCVKQYVERPYLWLAG